MQDYIRINDCVIRGDVWSVQHYLQKKGYFAKDYFNKLHNQCLDRVRRTIDTNKDALLDLVRELNVGRYGSSMHAVRLLVYGEACISSFISRLQTYGQNLYAHYIKEEICQAFNDDYMKMPEYVRNAIPKEIMVSEIVKSFLNENKQNIRKAVSHEVYASLRKVIDEELF